MLTLLELAGALDDTLDALDDALDVISDAVDDLVIGNVTDDSDSEGSSFSGDYEESSGSEVTNFYVVVLFVVYLIIMIKLIP